MATKNKLCISGIVVAILVSILLCSSIVVTNQSEYTVVRRFGKIEEVVSEPGISWKTPFIESVSKVSKAIRIYDIPESEVITKDKKNMVVDCFVTWKITDPVKFAQSLNSSVSAAEARLDSNVFNAVKNTISSIDQNNVISGRDTELNEKIMNRISSTENYGIEILSIEIRKLDLPTDNKKAVYERMISERDEIAAKYTAEGDAESRKLKNETDKTVAIKLSNAKTQAEEIIAAGEKEYMRILREAYAEPGKEEFYKFQLELSAIEKYMVGDKTLILPAGSPLFSLFINGYETE